MSTRIKILHAEDDQVSRRLLADILAREPDCELIEARNGEEAWRLLEAGVRPDLCIMDVMMPGLDGISLLCRMRADERFAKLRVILGTVLRERHYIQAAAELGVDYYLVKPFTEKLVQELIQRVRLSRFQSVGDDSMAVVSARLGLDPAACTERLAEFALKLNHSLEAVEKCLANLDTHTAARHLSGLKSTADNLGLHSLRAELVHLENIPAAFNQSSLGPPGGARDPAVFKEWRQEAWRREYCNEVVPSLARLRRMAERWRSEEVAASPTCEACRQPLPAGAVA